MRPAHATQIAGAIHLDRAAEAGFTLLEMIVVLAVLGLMAGLVVARGPSRSPALDLRAAASELAQALRGARARAIATDRLVMVRMDPRAHRFAVDDAPPRTLPAALALRLVPDPEGSPEEGAADRPGGIGFAPDGSSTGGRIDLAAGARHLVLTIDWLTGRVRIDAATADVR
jgi:general secretion pathway protein H